MATDPSSVFPTIACGAGLCIPLGSCNAAGRERQGARCETLGARVGARDDHAACCRLRAVKQQATTFKQLVDDHLPQLIAGTGRAALPTTTTFWRMVHRDLVWPPSLSSSATALLLILSCSLLQVAADTISTNTPVPPLQWLNLSSSVQGSQPPGLKDASIGYDPAQNRIIVFGGESQQGVPQSQTYL